MKQGKIIRIISNLYTVDINGENVDCQARGKFRNESITPLVGDLCEVDIENKYIMKILPRKNYMLRPSIANVDSALIITSMKQPNYQPNLLDKLITVVTLHQIKPILCFTKIDLLTEKEQQNFNILKHYYESAGYPVFTNTEILKIKSYLKDQIVVVTGQTGAGKSTLLNKLDERLSLKTSPISNALNRGVHTTRHTELFHVNNFYIADTPGFSSLDLQKFTKEEIKSAFPEFEKFPCRFKDCNHLKEQDCGVKDAVENKEILNTRYQSYQAFINEVLK